jgi:hypothetical protein
VRLSADYVALDATGPQVIVNAHVDLAHAVWTDATWRRGPNVEIVGGLYDADGRRRARLRPAEPRSSRDRDHPRAIAQGLTYRHVLPLPPGRYEVRLLARQAGGGHAGSRARRSRCRPGGHAPTLSGVFLAARHEEVAAAGRHPRPGGPALPPRVLESTSRSTRTTSPTPTPQARRRCCRRRSGRRRQDARASKPVPLRLERKDGTVLPRPNTIGLAGLEPGAYELRVVVVDRKANATATRRLDFAIE